MPQSWWELRNVSAGTPKIHSCGVLCPVVPGAGKGARDRSAGCSPPLSCCPQLLGCQVLGAWALLCSSPCLEEGSWRPCGCREAGRRCGCCGAGRASSSLNPGSRSRASPRPNSCWVCAPEAAGQGAAPVPTPQGCFLPLLAGLAVPPWLGGQLCSCWGWEQAKSRSISQQSLAAEPCSPSPCRAAELPLAASRGSGAPRGPGCCVPCAGWGLPALGERRPQLFYIPSASVSCARSNHLLQ